MKNILSRFIISVVISAGSAGSAAVAAEAMPARVHLYERAASLVVAFGGATHAVPVELSEAAEPMLTARGTLYQVAGTVVMPVAKDLPVVVEAAVAAAQGSQHRATVALPLPSVRVPTAMVLKLEARGGGADAAWHPAGEVFLRVLPAQSAMVEALRKQFGWLRERGVVPVVFGASPALRELFQKLDVPVESISSLAEVTTDSRRLFLGEGGAGELPAALRQGVALIRWTRDPFRSEGVDISRSARSFTVSINHTTAVRADGARLWAELFDSLSQLQLQLQPNVSL